MSSFFINAAARPFCPILVNFRNQGHVPFPYNGIPDVEIPFGKKLDDCKSRCRRFRLQTCPARRSTRLLFLFSAMASLLYLVRLFLLRSRLLRLKSLNLDLAFVLPGLGQVEMHLHL